LEKSRLQFRIDVNPFVLLVKPGTALPGNNTQLEMIHTLLLHYVYTLLLLFFLYPSKEGLRN